MAFSVPTGNFGNVFAGYVAVKMGLPVERLIIASNQNDILPRFFASGAMARESVVPSLSPSMDIQVSSNFERLLFELLDRDLTSGGVSDAARRVEVVSAPGISALQAARHALRADAFLYFPRGGTVRESPRYCR